VKKILVLALLTGGIMAGLCTPASAQVIPNVRGLKPFTAQTNYMSIPGYLRWQYFVENKAWISRAEAEALVRSQATTGT